MWNSTLGLYPSHDRACSTVYEPSQIPVLGHIFYLHDMTYVMHFGLVCLLMVSCKQKVKDLKNAIMLACQCCWYISFNHS